MTVLCFNDAKMLNHTGRACATLLQQMDERIKGHDPRQLVQSLRVALALPVLCFMRRKDAESHRQSLCHTQLQQMNVEIEGHAPGHWSESSVWHWLCQCCVSTTPECWITQTEPVPHSCNRWTGELKE